MYKICSAAQMRQADVDSIEKCGIPGIILMENAAIGCVSEIISDFGSVFGLKVACFCGKGNNGGDGLAIARLLSRRGALVTVYLTHGDSYRGDAAINREILSHMEVSICHVGDDISLRIPAYDIIVDAIFGTGMYGVVDDETYSLIDAVNTYGKYILSVDIPSGVVADTGEICGICVNATKTVTFAAYKTGLFLFPACDYAGVVRVCDICTPEGVLSEVNKYCIDESFAAESFPARFDNSHKGDYGKVLIIGGSVGLTGAPSMAAEAALKTGAGLVTVAAPASLNEILEAKLTEAMTYPLADRGGHLLPDCTEALLPLLNRADAVLFGPGLGGGNDILEVLKFVMEHCTVPLIIDADGLNALSKNIKLIENCSCNLIFTPHEIEMSRLCQAPLSEVTENRIQLSSSFAQEFGVTLILKGHHTVVTAADGTQYINNTGNPGLATGGSGDVLAGITAAMAARGIREDTAAATAVYIHGISGDAAAAALGKDSMTATDVIRFLPQTIKKIQEAKITCRKNEFSMI